MPTVSSVPRIRRSASQRPEASDPSAAAISSMPLQSFKPTLLPSLLGLITTSRPSFAESSAASGALAASKATPSITGTPTLAERAFVSDLSIVTALAAASQPE